MINSVNDGIATLQKVVTSKVNNLIQTSFQVIANGVTWVINGNNILLINIIYFKKCIYMNIAGLINTSEALVDMFQTAFSILVTPFTVLSNWLSHLFPWDDIKAASGMVKGVMESMVCMKDSIGSTPKLGCYVTINWLASALAAVFDFISFSAVWTLYKQATSPIEILDYVCLEKKEKL